MKGFGLQWHQHRSVAANLHLASDKQPHQHIVTQFLQAGCSSQCPTNSVKTLKTEGNVLCLISMQVLARLRVGELTKHNVVKCCLWPWGDSIAANGNNKTVRRYHISPPFCCCQMIAQFNYTQHRRRKGSVVGGHLGECGARAYNGGLGAEPPAGSRGRAPGQEVRGAKPP